MFLTVLGIGNAWGATTTYTFNSLSWGATSGGSAANWTSGKDANAFTSGKGVQVTSAKSGANATSPVSFSNVSQVKVIYNTNKTAGAGTIKIKIGSNSEVSTAVQYHSVEDGTSADYETTFRFEPRQSGSIKLTTDVTTNSIWIKEIEITYGNNASAYTISFNAGSGIYSGSDIPEGSANAGITLPNASPSVACAAEGWAFYGWATAQKTSSPTTAPEIVGKYGDKYYPTSSHTLYAVYASGEYTKITSSGDLTAGGKYLIAFVDGGGQNYIMSNTHTYVAGWGQLDGRAISETNTTSHTYNAAAIYTGDVFTVETTASLSVATGDLMVKNVKDGKYISPDYMNFYVSFDFENDEVDGNTIAYSTGWTITNVYNESSNKVYFDATNHVFTLTTSTASNLLIYKETTTANYSSTPSCCEYEVSVSESGSSHITSMAFSESSVATCGDAASRTITITVTPSSGYTLFGDTKPVFTKTSGTVAATIGSVTDNGNGTFSYECTFASNNDGAGTFAISPGQFTNYRTICVITYDITLDDGEVATTYNGSAKVASGGTQLKNISAPTKTGYKVAGYYAESGKTNKVAAADGTLEKGVEISSTAWTNSNGEWVKGSNATFYTKWEAISYEVQFNANDENYLGDATGSMSNQSFDYDESKELTENEFSLAGYEFAGWATSANGDVEHLDEAEVDNLSSTDGDVVDLYAKWTALEYDVTLAATNETSSVGSQTVKATFNTAMPLKTTADGTPAVAAPSRTGYTFDGWEYNSTQYYSYNSGTGVIASAHVWDIANSTTTLTPRWNINSYTLTWDLAGGTVTEAGTGAAVDATGTPYSSVNYGASITAPTVTKAGYNFAGWDESPASTMPASNTTYTATWTEKTVTGWTFTNHRGGAEITSDPIVVYQGQKVQLDIAYIPSDVLATHTVKENYSQTSTNTYIYNPTKASAYFTFTGNNPTTSTTTITLTHTEDTSDPKAFAKTVNVEVRALPTDTYLDLVHGVSFSGPYGASLIDSDYGVQFTYTAPGGDVSDWSSSYANTCEQYHVHLIGWVESTWANEHLGDAEMPDTDDIISSGYYHPVGETMTVSGKTFYAVWAKVE